MKIFFIALLSLSTITSAWSAAAVDHKKFIGDFRGKSFVGRKDLRYAYFEGDISRANFTGCDLTGATIKGLALNTNFYRANMRGFQFQNVNAAGSNFALANLSHALVWGRFADGNFRMAVLDFANAHDSNFDRAIFDYASLHKFAGTSASFFKARLYRANVIGSVLYNVNMALSNVTGAVFIDNDLRKTNQYHLKWPTTTYFKNNNMAGRFFELANPQ
ncbi:pentapeptide repeat-containing protein [Crenothrix sp.]|uniref:pentapeptide repeat-containing protein n=1 Tax=Crenothrix sp. TaxID=3100433 RepID=UPI00374DDA08